jgi:hypothetical protein
MTETQAKQIVMGIVAIATLCIGAPAHSHDLRIGTRTNLSAKVSTEGTLVRVDGYLRDNVGQGVSGEIVTVEFERVENPTGIASGDARTDRTGRFYRVQRLGTGTFRGSIHYSGREHYYASSHFDFRVDSKRGTLLLALEAPKFVVGGNPLDVRVVATSAGRPLAGIPLRVSMGSDSLEVETGKRGVATLTLDADASSAGQTVILARFVGDLDYADAGARTTVRVLDGPAWDDFAATSVYQRLRRGVRAEGHFSDRGGPVSGVPVEVVLSGAGAQITRFSTETDEDGALQIFLSESSLEPGRAEVVAVAQVGSAKIATDQVAVVVTKTGTGLVAKMLGLAVCVLVLLIVAGREMVGDFRRRRPETAPKRVRVSLEAARAPAVSTMPRPDSQDFAVDGQDADGLAGVISDAQTKEPVSGARVVVYDGQAELIQDTTADASGVFRFQGIRAGSYEMQARAKGYVTAVFPFDMPHGGQLAWFRLPVTPVRVVVRDLYEGLVEELGTTRDPWGRLTPRQTVALMLDAVRAPAAPSRDDLSEGYQAFRERLAAVLEARRTGEALRGEDLVSAIVEVLEEVYYSSRLHDEAVATIMERLTLDVRARAREVI